MFRFALPFVLGLAVTLVGGCADSPRQVSVEQPIAFPHQTHLDYFSSGRHRQEKIQMHLAIFDAKEPPEELAQGRCVECHDDLPERTACAGCHVQFQDATLRNLKDVRRCVGCHRGAWSGTVATIPGRAVCSSCHDAAWDAKNLRNIPSVVQVAMRGDQAPGQPPTPDISSAEIPWIQINTVPDNVYFSHAAHVRDQSIACTRCHVDVSQLTAPPTSVRVITMGACLRCHVENRASTDCLTCHK